MACSIDVILYPKLSQALPIDCLSSSSQNRIFKQKSIANSSHYAVQNKLQKMQVETPEDSKPQSRKKTITRSHILM